MKTKIKWIITAIILIAITSIYSVVDKNQPVYDRNVDSSKFHALEMKKGDAVRQTFVCEEEHLNGMAAKITAEGDADNIIVEYTLKEQSGNLAAGGEVSLAKLKNGKFFQFKFDQISECSGKKYVFELKVKESKSDSKVVVYDSPGTQKGTELFVGRERVEGTMVLRTITHRFDIETFVVTLCFLIYVVLFMRWLSKLFK